MSDDGVRFTRTRRNRTPWATSDRKNRLPADWPKIRARVWRRDRGLCQWPLTETSICEAPGRDVDHRIAPDDHDPASLWVLCGPHHDAKTQAEAQAGRVYQRRPHEDHPGIT